MSGSRICTLVRLFSHSAYRRTRLRLTIKSSHNLTTCWNCMGWDTLTSTWTCLVQIVLHRYRKRRLLFYQKSIPNDFFMLLSSNTRSCRYNQLLTSSMYPLSQQHIVSFLPYRAVNDLFIRHGRDQFQRSWLDRSETFSQNSDQAIALWTRQQWASAVLPCTNYLISLSQYLFALDLCFRKCYCYHHCILVYRL